MTFNRLYKLILESNDKDTQYLAAIEVGDMETVQRMVDEAARAANFPTRGKIVEWFNDKNPFEDEGLYASDIVSVFIVGSRAKRTARSDSDYDVAVEFPAEDIEDTGLNPIKLSEMLHQTFGVEMPRVNGLDIDIQIFAKGGSEQSNYSKISLDPITYDDNGNIIPLSQRFDSTKDDIRY
jgi:predicted nucleotidyltransferase